MVAEILLFMFLCLYHFAEGCTEGYTWAKPTRRKKNRLIQGRMGEGAAYIDYHGWRYGENIGIFFSVILGFYIHRNQKEYSILKYNFLPGSGYALYNP